MKAKFKTNAGIIGLIIGFVFLCNPEIAVFDIFPDFIGYAIILSSLSNLSDMFYQFDDAKRAFRNGMYISLLKLVSIFVIFGVFDYANRASGMLLFTFTFAILELIFLLPGYKKLFEGFLYSATRIDTHSIFLCGYNDKEHNKNLEKCKAAGKTPITITTKAYRFAVLFVIIKNIFTLAPELTTLISDSKYRFITLLRGFAAVISLVFGLVFIIRMTRYFLVLKRDVAYINGLREKYESEVMPKTHIFTSRKVRFSLSFAIAAVFLSVNIYNDEINLISGVIFFALALAFFCMTKGESKASKSGIIFSIIGIAISGAEWVMSIIFYTNHYVGEVSKFPHAYAEYYRMAAFSVAHTALYILTVALMLRTVYFICAKHTGKPLLEGGVIVSNITHKGDMKEYRNNFIIVMAFCILASLAYLFNIFASPFSVKFWAFEMSQMIDIILGVVFALYFAYAISSVKRDLNDCYLRY